MVLWATREALESSACVSPRPRRSRFSFCPVVATYFPSRFVYAYQDRPNIPLKLIKANFICRLPLINDIKADKILLQSKEIKSETLDNVVARAAEAEGVRRSAGRGHYREAVRHLGAKG